MTVIFSAVAVRFPSAFIGLRKHVADTDTTISGDINGSATRFSIGQTKAYKNDFLEGPHSSSDNLTKRKKV